MTPPESPTVKSSLTSWYLKRTTLFESLAPETVSEITKVLRVSEYKRSSPVFTPGQEPGNTYILLRGSVKVSRVEVSDGKELILYLVKPGEPFGAWNSVTMKDVKRVAVAHQKSLVGVLDKNKWMRLLADDPELNRTALRIASSRLQELQGRMAEIAYREVDCRIARLLIRLSREYPQKRDCGVQIRMPFTQQDISDMIAATREMTSLTINEFKRRGWISMHGRRICIHKPRSLKTVAE
jgi:CRP/FNR family transcriptional regulator